MEFFNDEIKQFSVFIQYKWFNISLMEDLNIKGHQKLRAWVVWFQALYNPVEKRRTCDLIIMIFGQKMKKGNNRSIIEQRAKDIIKKHMNLLRPYGEIIGVEYDMIHFQPFKQYIKFLETVKYFHYEIGIPYEFVIKMNQPETNENVR